MIDSDNAVSLDGGMKHRSQPAIGASLSTCNSHMKLKLMTWCCCLLAASTANAYTSFTDDYRATSDKGYFNIMFGERLNCIGQDSSGFDIYEERRSGMQPGTVYYDQFVQSVVRAFNTLENTVTNKPSRTINIEVVFTISDAGEQGATADPNWQDRNSSGSSLTFGDLGADGSIAGLSAHVNKLEYIWKYGQNDTGTQGFYDVRIYYSATTPYSDANASFGSFFVGADAGDYTQGQYDVETITLHEMGHALGFHSGYDYTTQTQTMGYSILDLTVSERPNPLPNGGIDSFFTGETATALNGGEEVKLTHDRTHTLSPQGLLMADGTSNPGAMRDFTELDKAMLQDLGWTLTNPIVVPTTPEPSTALLSLLALSGLVARRRRRS